MGTIKIPLQGPSGRLAEDAASGSPNFGNTSTGSISEKRLFLEWQKEILLVENREQIYCNKLVIASSFILKAKGGGC